MKMTIELRRALQAFRYWKQGFAMEQDIAGVKRRGKWYDELPKEERRLIKAFDSVMRAERH